MKKEDQDFYFKIAEVCLANAEQFCKDAILLRENNSPGHAYSLAVLGFEALAKAWIAYDLVIGITKESDELIDLMQIDHKTKQIYLWDNFHKLIMIEWLKERGGIKESLEMPSQNKLSTKMNNAKIKRIIQSDSKNKANKNLANLASVLLDIDKVISQISANYKLMQDKKNNGFYVQFDFGNKQIINNPLDFDKNPIFIETLNGFLGISKDIIIGLKETIENPEVKAFVQEARNIVEKIRLSIEPDEEKN